MTNRTYTTLATVNRKVGTRLEVVATIPVTATVTTNRAGAEIHTFKMDVSGVKTEEGDIINVRAVLEEKVEEGGETTE